LNIQRPLAVLLALQALILVSAYIDDGGARHDFASYYVAGLNILEHRPDRLYETSDGLVMPEERCQAIRARGFPGDYVPRYLYHPFWALLVAPLALLPYGTAATAFVGGAVLVLFLWLGLLLKRGDLNALGAAGLGLSVILFYPTRAAMDYGQFSLYVMPALGLMTLAPASRAAGLLLGFILIGSPYLLPVLAISLLDRRLRRCGMACLVFLAVVTAISMAALGTQAIANYLETLGSSLVGRTHLISIYAGRQSLLHQAYRALIGTSMDSEVSGAVEPLPVAVRATYLIGAGGLLAATFWILSRSKDLLGRIHVATLGSLLATPHAWTHYFNVLFVPAIWSFRAGNRAAALVAVAGLLICNLPLRYGSSLTRLLTFNCYLGALIMGLAVLLTLRHPPPAEPGLDSPNTPL
jgi:hypothetical protein